MIGLIFIGDLKYCPYLNFYTNILEEKKKEYEVLYWSREEQSDNTLPKNYKSFTYTSSLNASKYDKVKGFYYFRKWLVKRIKKMKYDKLIILSTLSGMIIADELLKKYSGKFIFDIRDYSYEHVSVFKKIEASLVKKSFFTGISSEGFLNFLPQSNKYVLIHNYNETYFEYKKFKKKNKLPLNIVWMGAVRYFDHQSKIITQLANDPRFTITYHGSGQDLEKFKKMVAEINAENIFFTGAYDNREKIKLLKNADILNNSYYTQKEMETKYAISNKFYDGIFYAIPQLGEINTYKSKLIDTYRIGFSIDVNQEGFPDKLIDKYNAFSAEVFNDNIHGLQKKVIEDNLKYKNKIIQFINSPLTKNGEIL